MGTRRPHIFPYDKQAAPQIQRGARYPAWDSVLIRITSSIPYRGWSGCSLPPDSKQLPRVRLFGQARLPRLLLAGQLVINRNHPHLILLPFSLLIPLFTHSYRTLPRSSSAARCRTITVYLKSSTRPRSGITDGPLSSFSSGSSSRPSVSCILLAHIAIPFADACMPLP